MSLPEHIKHNVNTTKFKNDGIFLVKRKINHGICECLNVLFTSVNLWFYGPIVNRILKTVMVNLSYV